MILASGSLKYRLISIIPNLLPPLMIFGAWGLWKGSIGQNVALAYAISLGLIIDDTAHILVKYLDAKKKGLTSEIAVKYVLENSAVALIMSTLIFGCAMLASNLSGFLPTRDQNNVVAAIFFLALAFDLFILPSLLIFFDDLFGGSSKKSDDDNLQGASDRDIAA